MLWMILTLMVALAAVGLAVPLIRRHDDARRARGSVVEVLKAQLGEMEAQAATGALPSDEAEALKTDVKRRVLAEGREAEPAGRPLSERTLLVLALGLVATAPAHADFSIVKFRSGYCRIWDHTAVAPPDGHFLWWRWHL